MSSIYKYLPFIAVFPTQRNISSDLLFLLNSRLMFHVRFFSFNPKMLFLGHPSHRGDLLLWVGVSCRPLCVMHHVLKSSQELLGQF